MTDAYRHAVDLNPRDYRAWYGLGQTYELLNMPYYALHYHRSDWTSCIEAATSLFVAQHRVTHSWCPKVRLRILCPCRPQAG